MTLSAPAMAHRGNRVPRGLLETVGSLRFQWKLGGLSLYRMQFEIKLRTLFAVLTTFCMLPFAAMASEYETELLYRKGSWTVELTHNTQEARLWCTASTVNSSGQVFSINLYDSRNAALFIFDYRWEIPRRPIRFLLDIDYSRWAMNGEGDGIGISIELSDEDKVPVFLEELSQGSAVALYNASERKLATFSLSGSSASILKAFDCWSQISVEADPFSEGDPFMSSEDPF